MKNIILTIVFLAVVAGGYYFYSTNTKQKTSNEKVEEKENFVYTTFDNKKYSFIGEEKFLEENYAFDNDSAESTFMGYLYHFNGDNNIFISEGTLDNKDFWFLANDVIFKKPVSNFDCKNYHICKTDGKTKLDGFRVGADSIIYFSFRKVEDKLFWFAVALPVDKNDLNWADLEKEIERIQIMKDKKVTTEFKKALEAILEQKKVKEYIKEQTIIADSFKTVE